MTIMWLRSSTSLIKTWNVLGSALNRLCLWLLVFPDRCEKSWCNRVNWWPRTPCAYAPRLWANTHSNNAPLFYCSCQFLRGLKQTPCKFHFFICVHNKLTLFAECGQNKQDIAFGVLKSKLRWYEVSFHPDFQNISNTHTPSKTNRNEKPLFRKTSIWSAFLFFPFRCQLKNSPACMYFSSCSRLCSTSAGVRVKIFFGGKLGTTLLPYSFLICKCKSKKRKRRKKNKKKG